MVTENADLQQQLQSSEREREAVRQQLTRKEAELIREQQQIQEMRQQVCMCMYMYMYVRTLLHVYVATLADNVYVYIMDISGGYQS